MAIALDLTALLPGDTITSRHGQLPRRVVLFFTIKPQSSPLCGSSQKPCCPASALPCFSGDLRVLSLRAGKRQLPTADL